MRLWLTGDTTYPVHLDLIENRFFYFGSNLSDQVGIYRPRSVRVVECMIEGIVERLLGRL